MIRCTGCCASLTSNPHPKPMSILTFFGSLTLGATFFLGVLGGPVGATLTIVWTWTLILSLASAINKKTPRQ